MYPYPPTNNGGAVPAANYGQTATFAGTGNENPIVDDVNKASATFNSPYDVAFDGAGNIYVAETSGNKIRKIVLASGFVSTFAGRIDQTAGQNDGLSTAARVSAWAPAPTTAKR